MPPHKTHHEPGATCGRLFKCNEPSTITPRSRLRATRRDPEATGFADIHCHCLPGLDDGPATMAEALALCRTLAEDGIGVVVACAHQLGRYEGRNTPGRIREAAAMLKDALHTEGISLKVLPGADVRLDERIPDLLTRDLVNTVADGGRYLLLELQEGIFIDVLPLVEQLSDRGVRTIITHPERNPCLINSHQQVMRWVAHGALLQLTAGSILGDFGPAVEAAARHWLGTGAAQLVATDAHGVRYRPPRLSKAADRITTSFGFAVARRTCINNPLAVVAGEEILAAPTTETSEMADA